IGAEIERGVARPAAIAAQSAIKPSGRPPTPSGPLWRRPIHSGVEARGVPGLAAHMSSLPAALGRFPALQGCSNCSLDREKCNSAYGTRNPHARKLFL